MRIFGQHKRVKRADRNARTRDLKLVQQVLLLLPTCESKMLAKWYGPYKVTRKVGKVTYELFMPDLGKKYQTFQINWLKEFHARPDPVRESFCESSKWGRRGFFLCSQNIK